jgi:hypothetical protein
LTNLVDASIAGTASITMVAADYTLSTANGAADESRAMFLVLGGTPGGSYNVIVPAVSKLYFVTNSTGAAQTVKTSAGTGISVPNGARIALRCDGTNVIEALNYVGSLTIGSITLSTPLGIASGGTGSSSTTYCSLTANVSGTLPVGSGGTGATTLTGLVKGNGTSAFSAAVAGTDYVTPAGSETLSNKTLASPVMTGTPTAPTATAGTSTTQVATTAFVAATAFSSVLPGQTGNAGKFVTTDGTNASWADINLTTSVTGTLPIGNGGTGQTTANAALNALLPSQTGNSGKYVTTDGSNTSWATVVAASLQEFTSSGTWTKPANATFVMVEAWGAGGGGGSGRRGAGSTVRGGGTGGGGGAYAYRLFKASDLPSTIPVTIGAGGAGGAARTTDDTNGVSGSAGGNTNFGFYLTAFGASGGTFGGTSSSAASKGGGVLSNQGEPSVGGGDFAGHFGTGSATTSGLATASGFGGGMGGGFDGTSTTYAGGCSYQGGPGGGAGGAISSGNSAVNGGGIGGGIIGTAGGGALSGGMGFAGFPGIGRQGGGGGGANTSVTNIGVYDVAFGNSILVAGLAGLGANTGLMATSTDNGTTWTFISAPVTTSGRPIYANSTWYVWTPGNGATIYASTNLATWSIATVLPSGANNLLYVNNIWIAIGNSGYLATSTDLVNWTVRTTGLSTTISNVAWTGVNYVAVASSGKAIYSSDLSTWTASTGLTGVSIVYDVAANGSTVVIATDTTPFTYISTNNGQSFTGTSSTTASTLQTAPSLRYLGGSFVLITATSSLYTSTDGNTWTLQADGTTDGYSGLAYTGTTWFVGSSTNNTTAGITSTNLTAWTSRTVTAIAVGAGGAGGAGGFASGGGGGAGSLNGNNSGAGGVGGNGLVRVYTW